MADGHRAAMPLCCGTWRYPLCCWTTWPWSTEGRRRHRLPGPAENEYPQGILAEVEALEPEPPQLAVNDPAGGASAFYQRASFVPCPFENTIFRVHYLVHLWCPSPLEHRERQAAQALDTPLRPPAAGGDLPQECIHPAPGGLSSPEEKNGHAAIAACP